MSAVIYPMPNIAEGLTSVSTNDDFSGAFPATEANDSTYASGHAWRCGAGVINGGNDGTLAAPSAFTVPFPVWWAIDISSLLFTQRLTNLFAWQFDVGTGAYAPDLISNFPNNLAKDYLIQTNTAPGGGSAPLTGWTTLVTVTGNTLHSKQHLINTNGANWIRIYVTAAHGSGGAFGNNNVAMKVAVHDARLGALDSWKIFGDSITQRAFMHDEANGLGSIVPKQIHSHFPGFYPYWEAAGIGGWTAQDIQPYFATWIADFPGKYVAINFGTNDSNLGGSYMTAFQSNMQNMITIALNAGKVVIIPTIPWLNTSSQAQTNINTNNAIIATLVSSNGPNCIAGPDLYSFFSTHQSDISSDGLHPTDPALSQGNGYVDYRIQWYNWAIANIYANVLNTPAQTHYKVRMQLDTPARTHYLVRMALKTPMQTHYKVQLSSVGPKPYSVTGVQTQVPPPRPFSTVTSTAIVVDKSNTPTDGLLCTVTVTYPDNTTSTPNVYAVANNTGEYYTTYETKGPGTVQELWVFTDTSGSQTEYRNPVVCQY